MSIPSTGVKQKFVLTLVLVLMLSGIGAFAKGGYILAKAEFAQHLMKSAWTQAQQSKTYQKPWWWADTHVLGTISFLDAQYHVLEGESGRNLAFGPALMTNTSSLEAHGNSVIVGHRDTHFSQLKHLVPGDTVIIESLVGEILYEVREIAVIEHTNVEVLTPSDISMLTLITCYPFNSVLADPNLRYVVRAVAKT